MPAATAQAAVTWPYGDFGKPGAIVSRREDKDLGATPRHLRPMARASSCGPSSLEKDSIAVNVGFGSGAAGVPAALTHAIWATSYYSVGGTTKLAIPDINRLMQTQGKLGSVSPVFGVTRFSLTGGTRPADFAFEMQLLAAFATDPGFRPELADRLKTVGPMIKTQIDTNAGAVFQRGLGDLLLGNDRRFSQTPGDADIDATLASDVPAIVRPQLGAPADIVIAGDISIDEAIRVTAATFGAMPRGARPKEPQPRIVMTAGREAPLYVPPWRPSGPGLLWPRLAAARLPRRFEAQLCRQCDRRAHQGAAGRHGAREAGSHLFAIGRCVRLRRAGGPGYLIVQAETPPDKFEAMRGGVMEVIGALARDPNSEDELSRAKKPLIEAVQKARETNGFWVRGLGLVLRQPRARDNVLNEDKALGAVTAQDVKALLARYVVGKTPLTAISQAK